MWMAEVDKVITPIHRTVVGDLSKFSCIGRMNSEGNAVVVPFRSIYCVVSQHDLHEYRLIVEQLHECVSIGAEFIDCV